MLVAEDIILFEQAVLFGARKLNFIVRNLWLSNFKITNSIRSLLMIGVQQVL